MWHSWEMALVCLFVRRTCSFLLLPQRLIHPIASRNYANHHRKSIITTVLSKSFILHGCQDPERRSCPRASLIKLPSLFGRRTSVNFDDLANIGDIMELDQSLDLPDLKQSITEGDHRDRSRTLCHTSHPSRPAPNHFLPSTSP